MEKSNAWSAEQVQAYTEAALLVCAQPGRAAHYLTHNLSPCATVFVDQLSESPQAPHEAFVSKLLDDNVLERDQETDRLVVGKEGTELINRYFRSMMQ